MVQPQPQESAPTDDVRSALNRSPMGQHLLMGESVLPYNQPDSTTDGATRVAVDGFHVKLQVYSRDLGKYVTYVGLLAPAANTTELKAALADAGIIEDGGATDLDLDDGDLTANNITATAAVVSDGTITAIGDLAVYGTMYAGGDATLNGAATVGGVLRGAGGITWAGDLDGDAGATIFVTDERVEGTFHHTGTLFGVFNATATTQPTITGAKGGNAALASLLTGGASLGLWTDSTT